MTKRTNVRIVSFAGEERGKMKLLAKPIDAMVVFRTDGKHPRPYKFKIEDDNGEKQTIFVDQVISSEKTKVCGA